MFDRALLVGSAALLIGCNTSASRQPALLRDAAPPLLRTLADARGLSLGAAADRGFRLTGEAGARYRAVLSREFGVLTPENDLKFQRLPPARGTFNFTWADSLVAFAAANGMGCGAIRWCGTAS